MLSQRGRCRPRAEGTRPRRAASAVTLGGPLRYWAVSRDRAAEFPAANALVGIALNDDDREFIESCCLEVGTRAATGNPRLGKR
jgi:hypothetical protein